MKNMLIATTLALLLTNNTLLADDQRSVNLGTKIGTLGMGLDISTSLNEDFSVRFNLNGASVTETDSEDGNDFEGTLDLLTAGLLLDYYPFENNFRLSTGAYYNGNGFTGTAKGAPGSTIDIGGTEYQSSELGSLDADMSFNSIAPYLGIGWGNNSHDSGWGFTFDLGAMYHGSGTANLTPNYGNQVTPEIKNEINQNILQEENSINDDLSSAKFYPVIAFGVNYSF